MRIVGLLLLFSIPLLAQRGREYVYEIRASQCTSSPASRSQTGFRVRTERGILTALHGVLDCKMIRAKSDYGETLTEPLSLSRYDVEADAALLLSDELQRKPLAGIDVGTPPVEGSHALVLGHPFSTSYHVTEVIIRRPPLRPLFEEVYGDVLDALTKRNSPSVKSNIISIQGEIVPGYSGAPVIDMNGYLMGVANGGLKGGTVGQAWAIPYSLIRLGRNATSARLADLTANVEGLFRFEPYDDPSLVGPVDNSCQLIRQAIASGQRGFTDLIGTTRNDVINSTLNLPGALYTTVTPNHYLSGRFPFFRTPSSQPSAEATAAYYKSVDTVSACLKGWKARPEKYWTGYLGIRFESDRSFVVRVHCEKLYGLSDGNTADACSIDLYPPGPSGVRSADLPKLDFTTVLSEMVEHARNNFAGYGAIGSGRDWQPLDNLPGAKCIGYFDSSRMASVQCDVLPTRCYLTAPACIAGSQECTARGNRGPDCDITQSHQSQFIEVTVKGIAEILGTSWTRSSHTTPGASALFVDGSGAIEIMISVWKQSSAPRPDTSASGVRITISQKRR